MKQAIYLMMALILVGSALGLGIAPASIEVQPGETQEFFIINNEHKDMDVVIHVENGQLSQSVLSIKSTEETKGFTVTYDAPGLEPGKHDIKVTAIEMPAEKTDTVVARQAVGALLEVIVPYPGKHAEAELVIPEKDVGEPLDFVVKIKNRGTQAIDKAYARIELYDQDGTIATLVSDEKSVKPDEKRELVARYLNPLKMGKYYARAVVVYDGKEIVLEEEFTIGNMLIEFKDIYVKEFRLGEIAKFDIKIKSLWNEQIPDVYADMEIKDSTGEVLSKYTSKEIDLPAESFDVIDSIHIHICAMHF